MRLPTKQESLGQYLEEIGIDKKSYEEIISESKTMWGTEKNTNSDYTDMVYEEMFPSLNKENHIPSNQVISINTLARQALEDNIKDSELNELEEQEYAKNNEQGERAND